MGRGGREWTAGSEAGKVGPVEFLLSGGGGAGRFGRVRVCGTTVAVTDFLSSSSSLSLKSSRLPISVGFTLIRLARLCMSSSVAFPSRTKTHDSDSLSVASTTLTDSGFSVSVRSVWVGVGLANRFRLMSADASTLRCPLFSPSMTNVHSLSSNSSALASLNSVTEMSMFSGTGHTTMPL